MKQKENTLIFLDEIQVYPQQLKFLAQVGKFTYIASGSLLGGYLVGNKLYSHGKYS